MIKLLIFTGAQDFLKILHLKVSSLKKTVWILRQQSASQPGCVPTLSARSSLPWELWRLASDSF